MPIKTGLLCIPSYDEAAADAVRRLLARHVPGFVLVVEQRAAMQRNLIEDLLCRWCDEDELDLVVTIGGTLPAPGPSAREIVPQATLAVAERQLPGFAEAMRAHAEAELPLAIIDSSAAAIRGRTLLINLPAGARPAALFLEAVAGAIAAVVAHLQDDPAAPQLAAPQDDSIEAESRAAGAEPPVKGGLDAGEFAAFLKRRSKE
jgi:molybdopterin biosynthesis enzyme MoaB